MQKGKLAKQRPEASSKKVRTYPKVRTKNLIANNSQLILQALKIILGKEYLQVCITLYLMLKSSTFKLKKTRIIKFLIFGSNFRMGPKCLKNRPLRQVF